jgi:hypothetical protein
MDVPRNIVLAAEVQQPFRQIIGPAASRQADKTGYRNNKPERYEIF